MFYPCDFALVEAGEEVLAEFGGEEDFVGGGGVWMEFGLFAGVRTGLGHCYGGGGGVAGGSVVGGMDLGA